MADTRPQLRLGRIVWADVKDANGFVKTRPAVVMSATAEIGLGKPLIVMAITTTYPDPPPADHVELPWHAQGHPVTRLTRRSAAVTTWMDTIMPDQIRGYGGGVPPKYMRKILERIGPAGP